MSSSPIIHIGPETIDRAAVVELIQDTGFGAENFFFGTVRNVNDNKEVLRLEYDAHPALCLKVFEEICQEAAAMTSFDTALALYHRTGMLELGEVSIAVAVGSPHRDESYRLNRYILENVKTRAPIWKREHYVSGPSEWLTGHVLRESSNQPSIG